MCKEKLVEDGYHKKPEEMNILDYKTLESTLCLESVEVGLLFWRPNIEYVKPFEGWTTKQPVLSWYSAYNTVKHNRINEFPHASLKNLRLAMSGLFSVFVALGFMGNVVAGGEMGEEFGKFFFEDRLFSFRCPTGNMKNIFRKNKRRKVLCHNMLMGE